MTTPNLPTDTSWAGNKFLPTANKSNGSGLGAVSTRTKEGWGSTLLGMFGDTAPKVKAIEQGLFGGWFNGAPASSDPLLAEAGQSENLVLNGEFAASTGWSSFSGGWSRDASVGRTQAGSAKVITSGALQTLTSNGIAVTAGQIVQVGAYAKWSSITGGSPCALVLQGFSGATLLVEQEIAAFTPAGSGGWLELLSGYTIPDAVDNVRLILEVQATAGTIWWDDVTLRKKADDRVAEVKQTADAAAAQSAANAVAITDLSEIVTLAKATQAWVGNYTDMASVPRVMVAPGMGVRSCSDGTHSHGMAALVPNVTKVTKSEGSIYFTPIIVDRQGDLDKFRFITGADSSLFSIDAYYVALMIYDIPNARFLTIWNPGNIKGSMGSSLSEVTLDMGLTGSAAALTPGQVLIAAHMQIAPGLAQTARSVAWVPQWGIARTADVLLPGCYWKSNSTYTSIPSTFSVSAATPQNDGIPWYAVSVTND